MEQLFTNLSHAVVGAPIVALAAAFIWGVLSIVLGPCTFAHLAPMLVVTFKPVANNFPYGARLLLLAYCIGHSSVIVAAGTSIEMVQRFLNWNEQSKGVAVLKCVCGVLVLLGGVRLNYAAP